MEREKKSKFTLDKPDEYSRSQMINVNINGDESDSYCVSLI